MCGKGLHSEVYEAATINDEINVSRSLIDEEARRAVSNPRPEERELRREGWTGTNAPHTNQPDKLYRLPLILSLPFQKSMHALLEGTGHCQPVPGGLLVSRVEPPRGAEGAFDTSKLRGESPPPGFPGADPVSPGI